MSKKGKSSDDAIAAFEAKMRTAAHEINREHSRQLHSAIDFVENEWCKRTKTFRRWVLEEERKDANGVYMFDTNKANKAVTENTRKSFVLSYQDENFDWQDENICCSSRMLYLHVSLPNDMTYRILCISEMFLDKFVMWVLSQKDLKELNDTMWGFIAAI